jgi:hypothetical protein
VGSLKPAARNPRTHSDSQIELIANSLLRFGVVSPVVVDHRNRIVAGHARWAAAKRLGLKWLPVIRLSNLSEDELRAYALADNQLATRSGWNRELLAIELAELQVTLPEIGLDLGITGFEPGEVDAILEDFSDGATSNADDLPKLTGEPAVSRSGDVFVLGQHRLLVGDARGAAAFVATILLERVRPVSNGSVAFSAQAAVTIIATPPDLCFQQSLPSSTSLQESRRREGVAEKLEARHRSISTLSLPPDKPSATRPGRSCRCRREME